MPATIVDRCHRFDFQRPSLEQIAGVLRRVAAEEEIQLPDPAVGMLARSATGSFRDALGTLEQLVTYGGKEVKLDDVRDILGVADAELVLDTSDALADRDPTRRFAGGSAAVRLRARLHTVHARPVGSPAPPVRGADAGGGAGLVLGHRRAHRPPRHAGRALLPGRDPAGDRLPRGRDRGGQGRLGAAHPARDGAAEGHPAAGRPVAAGADVPHRAARGAARRRGGAGRAGARERRGAAAHSGPGALGRRRPGRRRRDGSQGGGGPGAGRRRGPRAAAGDLARGGRGGDRGERDARSGPGSGAPDGRSKAIA